MLDILWNHPAFLLDKKILVIGDIHIGLEYELFKEGIHLPSLTNNMLNYILNLIENTKAKKLVILGDIKNSIAKISPQEAKEVPYFMKTLSEHVELLLVFGNHDGGLKKTLSEYPIYPSSGFLYKKYLLMHGNAKPKKEDISKCNQIIACHWHPVYEFKDKFGGRVVERIWVEARTFEKKLLIMPYFNRLLGGVTLDKITDKWIDLDGAKIHLLDGIYLGEFHKRK